MSGYSFLSGVRVLEVAQLGPSSLGGYLADMGAEVIKVEDDAGDPLRSSGPIAVGAPNGPSLMHLRWNRGKRSVGIDLRSEPGQELFKQLAAGSDIVIEGMRGGFLDTLGLGYEALRERNPRLVFCSLSGLGRSGPYAAMGSHGPSFDAFGGLSSRNPYARAADDGTDATQVPVGMHAMGLYAAVGVLAALHRAQQTGEGAQIEVSGAEAAAHWLPEGVDRVVNRDHVHSRPGFSAADGRMRHWPRLCRYECADGRGLFFQALSPKFWTRFCELTGRADLMAVEDDDQLHVALTEVLAGRTREEWMTVLAGSGIPAGPANTLEELAVDPHFLARENQYEVDYPGAGALRLTSTPIKAAGQPFSPELAPRRAQHTEEVLLGILHLDDSELASLRSEGVLR